jgi:8-oxo-dGTP diphosphatase
MNERDILDVAAGVIFRDDGRVLLAERPAGKPLAGCWEFPGGKFEHGENPVQALARELHEELGIELDVAHPWITRTHAYPDRRVRLHMHRVMRWHGEPHGREGQQLSWEDPRAVGVSPLLSANDGILQALNLPPLYAITHASKYGRAAFMARLRTALDNGVQLIQVRERGLPPDELAAFAGDVVAVANGYGARVLINGDAGLARETGADGVHLPSQQLLHYRTRPEGLQLLAASCHDREELLRAADLGVDFAVLSPVLPTHSHPGAATLGWVRFMELCLDLPMPVYALGGMRADMLDIAIAHSAHGVALLSGIW